MLVVRKCSWYQHISVLSDRPSTLAPSMLVSIWKRLRNKPRSPALWHVLISYEGSMNKNVELCDIYAADVYALMPLVERCFIPRAPVGKWCDACVTRYRDHGASVPLDKLSEYGAA